MEAIVWIDLLQQHRPREYPHGAARIVDVDMEVPLVVVVVVVCRRGSSISRNSASVSQPIKRQDADGARDRIRISIADIARSSGNIRSK